jgi:transglutaminase-like putative cysteine protease
VSLHYGELVRVRVGCSFVHVATVPTHAVLQVEPRTDVAGTVVEGIWDNYPPSTGTTYVDTYGNLCRRLTIPDGRSSLSYDALVEIDGSPDAVRVDAREVAADGLPDDALVFTLPSRYCPSDELADEAWSLFGSVDPGWNRAQAICDWVHDSIEYTSGSSTQLTTAVDVYKARAGVCRDFAHLAVTFCRAFSIPTRYAVGYLPDIGVTPPEEPMDFCAWTEVFLDDRWWTFDPRNNVPRIGRVLIGRGRDALDVAMITAFGGAELETMAVHADEAAP